MFYSIIVKISSCSEPSSRTKTELFESKAIIKFKIICNYKPANSTQYASLKMVVMNVGTSSTMKNESIFY